MQINERNKMKRLSINPQIKSAQSGYRDLAIGIYEYPTQIFPADALKMFRGHLKTIF